MCYLLSYAQCTQCTSYHIIIKCLIYKFFVLLRQSVRLFVYILIWWLHFLRIIHSIDVLCAPSRGFFSLRFQNFNKLQFLHHLHAIKQFIAYCISACVCDVYVHDACVEVPFLLHTRIMLSISCIASYFFFSFTLFAIHATSFIDHFKMHPH